MRRHIIVSILIGLTLILSTFISTVSMVQKIAYAQARMEPSMNGVPVPNSMTQRSMVVGSNAEPGRNIAVQPALAVQLIRDGRSITNGPQVPTVQTGGKTTSTAKTNNADVANTANTNHKLDFAPLIYIGSAIKVVISGQIIIPFVPPHPPGTNHKGVSSTTTTHSTANNDAVFGAFFQTAGSRDISSPS
jgi:hypothetical protein